MADNIDHDRLFKELISTFFVDFIALFFPSILEYLDTNSVNFLDKEIFTDVTQGEKYESDLVAQVKFRGEQSFFLVHIEAQSTARSGFNRRMFNYLAPFIPLSSFPTIVPKKQPSIGMKSRFLISRFWNLIIKSSN
jgi:predicted transposase YdaD